MLILNSIKAYALASAQIAFILFALTDEARCQSVNHGGDKIIAIKNLGKIPVVMGLAKTYTVEVAQNESHSQEPFREDWLVLRIRDEYGKIIGSKEFYSSYQQFRIYMVDLDGDGQREFIFALGEGRGTSARRETLSIERFESSQWKRVLTTPLSDYYGSGLRWWYSVDFQDVDGNGTTDLLLRLRADDDSGKEDIPIEQVKIFKWRKASDNESKADSTLDVEFGRGPTDAVPHKP